MEAQAERALVCLSSSFIEVEANGCPPISVEAPKRSVLNRSLVGGRLDVPCRREIRWAGTFGVGGTGSCRYRWARCRR
jgi:hypothetical protein